MNAKSNFLLVAYVVAVACGAPDARADFTFGARVSLGPVVNSPQGDSIPVVSPDGLELYFASNRPGGSGDYDIWVSKRPSTEAPWEPPANLGPGINSTGQEFPTSVSSDGLTLYFFAYMFTYRDLYTATRPTKDAPWSPRVSLGQIINRPQAGGEAVWGQDAGGIISPDGLELFFWSYRLRPADWSEIYVTTRATTADLWGPPVNVGPPVNSAGTEVPVSITPDGLVLFIGTTRPGGFGGWDTWMARRAYRGAGWSEPVNLGPSFNTSRGEVLTSLSSDGRWCYIGEYESAGPVGDLWMAPIIPIVDFNVDGKTDVVDLVLLVNDWGTNNPRCDIGPFAWGDGKVDIEDLRVFMTYYEKANLPQANEDK